MAACLQEDAAPPLPLRLSTLRRKSSVKRQEVDWKRADRGVFVFVLCALHLFLNGSVCVCVCVL